MKENINNDTEKSFFILFLETKNLHIMYWKTNPKRNVHP